MKIVCIFDKQLYAIHTENEADNEFDRLIELWKDTLYLRSYAKQHNISNVNQWVNARLRDAEEFEDRLDAATLKEEPLDTFFIPFHDNEYGREMQLSQRKGKLRYNHLRLYAVKVHDNCYVITGGCIKTSQATQDNKENDQEIDKLKTMRDYLKAQGIIDDLSFYEFLKEQE